MSPRWPTFEPPAWERVSWYLVHALAYSTRVLLLALRSIIGHRCVKRWDCRTCRATVEVFRRNVALYLAGLASSRLHRADCIVPPALVVLVC